MGVQRTYRLLFILCILLITTLHLPVQTAAASETISIDKELRTGTCVTIQSKEPGYWGETIWQVENPAVLRLDRTTGTSVRVYPLKVGKTTIIARTNDTALIYRVNVTAGKSLKEPGRKLLKFGYTVY